MPSEYTKILEFNQYQKSDKAQFVIYEDFKCVKGKINGCKNNTENSSRAKVSEHIPSRSSIPTISSFNSTENSHDVYRDKNCRKNFCETLRQHEMNIINFKKRLLTKEQLELYKNAKICYNCQEKIENKYLKGNKYRKVRDNYHNASESRGYGGAAHSICNLKYSIPKKNLIFFQNKFNYAIYHKKLAERFKKQFTYLGENSEKHIIFTISIERKITTTNKNEEKITKSILHIKIY